MQLIYQIERHGNFNVEFTGDEIPQGESAFVLPNHANHDWAHIYAVGLRRGHLDAVRCVLVRKPCCSVHGTLTLTRALRGCSICLALGFCQTVSC